MPHLSILSIALGLIALLPAAPAAATELVLNQSFEINTYSNTAFNQPNADITAGVANVTAFGSANEVDITMLGGDAYYGPPAFGDWFLTLHTQVSGIRDGISIELSSPLIAGGLYDLSFWAKARQGKVTSLEIGVSTVADDFGSLVYATTDYSGSAFLWTFLQDQFIAPDHSSYLTLRPGATAESLVSADQFSLRLLQVPEPSGVVLALLGIVAFAMLCGFGRTC